MRSSPGVLDKAKLGSEPELVTRVCATCGFRSDIAGFFRQEKGGAFGIPRSVCEGCNRYRPSAAERRLLWSTAISYLIWLPIIVSFVTGGHGADRRSNLLFFSAFLLSPVLRTVVHEAGHAIAAIFLGAQVLGIRIGFGPAQRRWRLGQTRIEVGRYVFLGGLTQFSFSETPPRWRTAVILLAGAAANLALAVLFLESGSLAERLLPPSLSDPLTPIFGGLGLSQLAGLLNLLSFNSAIDGLPSDGRQLVRLIFQKARAAPDWAIPSTQASVLSEWGRFEDAAELFVRAADLKPDSPLLFAAALHCLQHAKGPEQAFAFFEARRAEIDAAIATPDEAHLVGVVILRANIASIAVMARPTPDLALADAYSRAAIEAEPENSAAQAARGEVLLAKGDASAAWPLLSTALRASISPVDRAQIAHRLAEAESERGDPQAAATFVDLARYASEAA